MCMYTLKTKHRAFNLKGIYHTFNRDSGILLGYIYPYNDVISVEAKLAFRYANTNQCCNVSLHSKSNHTKLQKTVISFYS